MKYILMISMVFSLNTQASEFDFEKTNPYEQVYKAQLQQMNEAVAARSGLNPRTEPMGEIEYTVQQFIEKGGVFYNNKFHSAGINPDYPGWLIECVLPTVENKVLPGWEALAAKEGQRGLFQTHYNQFKNLSVNIMIENTKLQTKGNDKILRHACDANRTYGLTDN